MPSDRKSEVIADLNNKPGHLIRRAHQLTGAIFEAKAGPFGLTPTQHVVMTALYNHPGVDQAKLAALVALDKVTVGHILTRLEQRGLIRRAQSETDGRARVLTLTEAGQRLLMEMQDAVRESQAMLLSPLSAAERKQFFQIMRRIVGLEPPHRPRKPAGPR